MFGLVAGSALTAVDRGWPPNVARVWPGAQPYSWRGRGSPRSGSLRPVAGSPSGARARSATVRLGPCARGETRPGDLTRSPRRAEVRGSAPLWLGRVMWDVRECAADARMLWAAGRREGAFVLALIAVSAAARHESNQGGDKARFEAYLQARFPMRFSAEYQGQQMSLETILYKLLRCSLVHEASLPVDVGFMEGLPEGQLSIRAGGAPDFVLLISPGWFHWLLGCALGE